MLRIELRPKSILKARYRGEDCPRLYIQLQEFYITDERRLTMSGLVSTKSSATKVDFNAILYAFHITKKSITPEKNTK